MSILYVLFSFGCLFSLRGVQGFHCYSEFCRNENFQGPENSTHGPQCLLTKTQTGSSCRDFKFPSLGNVLPHRTKTAKIYLSAYSTPQLITSFNISFPKVSFLRLYTRYQDLNDQTASYCRHISFYRIHESPKLPSFYVHCPFTSDVSFEGEAYQLEYLIRWANYEYSGRLLFNVPYHYDIDIKNRNVTNFVPFVYADVSSASVLSLNIQPLPKQFNVTDYRLWVFNNESTTVQVIDLKAQNSEEHIAYNVTVVSGQYTFRIAAMHPACGAYGCRNGTLPAINASEPPRRLLIMIISFVWIPPVLLFAIYSGLNWYRRRIVHKTVKRRPKCLLVYEPYYDSHIRVAQYLSEYLNSCFIDCMIDTLDIPMTQSKDPIEWCRHAFEAADVIIVAASPRLPKYSEHAIYTNIQPHVLRLLNENYSLKKKKRHVVVTFPYTTDDDIPHEARNFKRFNVSTQAWELVKFINKYYCFPKTSNLPDLLALSIIDADGHVRPGRINEVPSQHERREMRKAILEQKKKRRHGGTHYAQYGISSTDDSELDKDLRKGQFPGYIIVDEVDWFDQIMSTDMYPGSAVSSSIDRTRSPPGSGLHINELNL